MAGLAAISLACGAITGGLTYISATRQINKQMKTVKQMASENGGRIMTAPDKYTSAEEVEQGYKKERLKATAKSAAMGTGLTFLLNVGLDYAAKLLKKAKV